MLQAASKKVQVRYYALLREQRGASQEFLVSAAATLRELYRELSERHQFSLPAERLRVAVNDQFRAWEEPLRENDVVVFIPPVAGG